MLYLLGANHRSAPLEIRERLAIHDGGVESTLRALVASAGVDEAFLLSTCNRAEVTLLANDVAAGEAAIRSLLVEQGGVAEEDIARYTYRHRGREAVRHLFRVTSGLDSMIVGEPQITGQVKQAFRRAKEVGAIGPTLERLLQASLSTAKRVRHETGISRHPVSIAYAAVELARQIFGDLRGRTALLLGAGKMSALVAKHLTARGVERLLVASRTFDHAGTVAERAGGRALNWDDALRHLGDADIVVSGTGATEPVLDRATVQRALRRRRTGPLFVIDLAVPRDVEPSVNTLDGVYLYDVDNLQGVVDDNLGVRRAAAVEAERLITREVESFERWFETLAVAPTIVSLREQLIELGRGEVSRYRKRLGPLTAAQESALDALARSIVGKIAHGPIRRLKAAVERGDAQRTAALVREVFDLEGDGRPSTARPPRAEERWTRRVARRKIGPKT